eukprot:gene20797-21504_t
MEIHDQAEVVIEATMEAVDEVVVILMAVEAVGVVEVMVAVEVEAVAVATEVGVVEAVDTVVVGVE